MKYFDEEKNIIKAQAGTSTYYFIRPPEPVVDNMGGLGSAVYHNQSIQRQQEVNKEQAAMEAQRRREEAVRRQPQLRQGKSESELQRSRQQQRQAELDQRRNEQRSTMINFDPTGTAHTQAAVQAMPYVAEATRNYFNRPIGEIIGGELNTASNLIMAPWTSMGHHLQQAGIAGQDGRYFDAAGNVLLATADGALILAGTRTPVGEVPAVQTASRAVNTTARRVKNTTSNAVNRVRQTAQTAGEQVSEGLRSFGNQVQEGFNYTFGQGPMLQPAYVGGVPGTMRTPWTLYEPTTGNYSQMNILDRTKAAIKAYKEHGKPSANTPTATPTATTEIEEGTLADIRQIGNRRKRVKVKGPDQINTSYTLDGKPIDKSKLSIEQKPTSDGHIVEEVIPGQQVYAYEGKPVSRNNVQQKNWFRHEGKYRQESDIQTQSNITEGSRIKPSEEVPEGSQFQDKKGKWKSLNNQMFRTATGKGPNSWIYYDGTPIEWYKNPGFYHRAGALGTLITAAVGSPNIIKTIKGAAKGAFTGNGIIPGVFNEYTGKNPQQTNDTTPENTPTNTPQTSDTTGRAERMAQRRKELGITE